MESVVHGIELGAEDYLPKTFDPILLRARISTCLEKKYLRDQQRNLFHTFATAEVAEELLTSGFALGGKSMDATIMFADIRSFTAYTEQHRPAEVVELLNDYFAAMFDPISRHGGIVNQIIGDGLMALFGTLNRIDEHRTQAVLAALEMLAVLQEFNQKRASENKGPIKIGIGIASGAVIAGYAGTQHRATYTCVGDTVNRAARIEAYTKKVRKPLLIDAETRSSLPDSMMVDSLGEVVFNEVYSVKTGEYIGVNAAQRYTVKGSRISCHKRLGESSLSFDQV